MNLSQVLNTLLQNLSQAIKQGDDQVNYSFADVQQWQAGVLPVLLDFKLIKPVSAAQSIECTGCENNCFMDVISYKVSLEINEQPRHYIVCEDSEKQAQMGRIQVPNEQLKQWQLSIKNVALLLAQLLDFDNNKLDVKQNSIRLGMLKSPHHGRKWASLNKQPLALDLSQIQIPLTELFFVDNGKLTIDRARIDAVLAVKQPIKAKDYQSNTDKLEQRKANTKAMHKSWQDEYEKLKRQHPNKPNQPKKTKSWYAYRISKMDIAQGKSKATIQRNIKN
jgi:hypothetical protein